MAHRVSNLHTAKIALSKSFWPPPPGNSWPALPRRWGDNGLPYGLAFGHLGTDREDCLTILQVHYSCGQRVRLTSGSCRGGFLWVALRNRDQDAWYATRGLGLTGLALRPSRSYSQRAECIIRSLASCRRASPIAARDGRLPAVWPAAPGQYREGSASQSSP